MLLQVKLYLQQLKVTKMTWMMKTSMILVEETLLQTQKMNSSSTIYLSVPS